MKKTHYVAVFTRWDKIMEEHNYNLLLQVLNTKSFKLTVYYVRKCSEDFEKVEIFNKNSRFLKIKLMGATEYYSLKLKDKVLICDNKYLEKNILSTQKPNCVFDLSCQLNLRDYAEHFSLSPHLYQY